VLCMEVVGVVIRQGRLNLCGYVDYEDKLM